MYYVLKVPSRSQSTIPDYLVGIKLGRRAQVVYGRSGLQRRDSGTQHLLWGPCRGHVETVME